MNTSPMQHALRELRRIFSSGLSQLLLGAAILLVGISGPFGTLDALSFGPRLAYWAITVPLTFAMGVFASAFLAFSLRDAKPGWLVPAGVALGSALSIGALVSLLNWMAFGTEPFAQASFAAGLLSVMSTAAVVALVLHFVQSNAATDPNHPPAPPALLERLELGKRGALISLSVQDHYVEVSTTNGQSLLLMRLSDAIRETGDVQGLQIHRSHWVALEHVQTAVRRGDKAVLTLTDGRQLPASRSNIKALKDVGILPV